MGSASRGRGRGAAARGGRYRVLSSELRRPAALFAILLAITAVAGLAAARGHRPPAAAPLVMAFTPSRDPTALQGAADAFVSLLSQLSGVAVRAQVASDYAGVIEALRSRRVDLAFVHPVGYVLARREAGCDILVRDVWQDRIAYKASFYVRKGKGIERLEDLRGRTIAFVDPASSSGYIYPMVLLIKRGLVQNRDPKTFFKEALFAGTHEGALRALLQGRVDAATTFDRAPQIHLKDPVLEAQLVSIAETPDIPEAGICARPGLSGQQVLALKQALLSMKRPDHAAVLKDIYDIDGFVAGKDSDYDPVRDALALMDYRPKR